VNSTENVFWMLLVVVAVGVWNFSAWRSRLVLFSDFMTDVEAGR
jgi:hypothetical protein